MSPEDAAKTSRSRGNESAPSEERTKPTVGRPRRRDGGGRPNRTLAQKKPEVSARGGSTHRTRSGGKPSSCLTQMSLSKGERGRERKNCMGKGGGNVQLSFKLAPVCAQLALAEKSKTETSYLRARRPPAVMQDATIIGANCAIGKHLFSRLQDTVKTISVWTLNAEFVDELESNQNNPTDGVNFYVGMDGLRSAIAGRDTVFNLHEYVDFSATPDHAALKQHNVEFVKRLLWICKTEKVEHLVHLSSIYLQCSGWWPNVGSREMEPANFLADNPFPAYFKSKFEAEKMVLTADHLKSIVTRVGPIYGEGDKCSIICDAIKLHEWLGFLPVVGDMGGALQLTYAGNAAEALISSAKKLAFDPSVHHEAINVQDGTPVQSLFFGVVRRCFEANGKRLSTTKIPFWVFFPLYFLLCMIGTLLQYAPFVKNPLQDLPSASFVYLLFRQWTFLSDYRMRLLLDFKPPVGPKEALRRIFDYYGKFLRSEDIKTYSWRSLTH
ncbi:Epimerase domain-containing protein [Aphelenchoides fujianensis]|nr:Epimerase domain-containing protein [Aphelenchoides fujianensis]